MTTAPVNDSFFKLVSNPFKFRLFMMKNLPAALFSGLKLVEANRERCRVSVPYKWFTKNPFRSTYFACLSMAAEMSTGIPAMAGVTGNKRPVSSLVVSVEGKFHKKATGLTIFTCTDGEQVLLAIGRAESSGEGEVVKMYSAGHNQQGELIAEFWITWSFKVKK
jgi:phage terminase large subunit-like protein